MYYVQQDLKKNKKIAIPSLLRRLKRFITQCIGDMVGEGVHLSSLLKCKDWSFISQRKRWLLYHKELNWFNAEVYCVVVLHQWFPKEIRIR